MAAIAVGLALVLSNQVRSDALDDLTDEAVGSASGRLLGAITPADLEVPMTGARYDNFHEFVQQSIVSDRTARVKIWAKDGTVIYSNDPAGVGEQFPAKENLLIALSGETATEIKTPKDAENAREQYLGTLMEVYTPIIFPGTTDPEGAFEIYQYYAPTAQRIEEMQRWVFGSIAVGFLVLYAALLFIVWRGQRGTLAYLAYHDPLTQLPNRTLLKDRLNLALAQARRHERKLAVMFMDLDRFKVVNDTAGHTTGDRLLQEIGKQLSRVVRGGDTVARVGGDEFILLLPQIMEITDASEIAERALDAVAKSRITTEHEFSITTSIGITVYPTDGDDVEALLKNADIAMYHAKAQGGNKYQFFAPPMNTSIQDRLVRERELRVALEREELVLHYQPQVDATTQKLTGFEALARWQHPERGLVGPDEFISLAEEIGVIQALGTWVMRTACEQMCAWLVEGCDEDLRVSVNVSAREFQDKDLVSTVRDSLKEAGLAAKNLAIEITESVAMKDAEHSISVLDQLKELGVHISIDDFGTGYSSLAYLKRFPIDAVKIDRSFVRDLSTDPGDAAIVASIIGLAKTLGLNTIAEGVETEAQLKFLKDHECPDVQGFLFSKPKPPDELKLAVASGFVRRSPVRVELNPFVNGH